jgi:hypothetical protein
MEDKAAKAQADSAKRQADSFKRQAGVIGRQSEEVVKQYTTQAQGAMGDWVLARSAAGMLDFNTDSKTADATKEISGIKTQYDFSGGDSDIIKQAKKDLEEFNTFSDPGRTLETVNGRTRGDIEGIIAAATINAPVIEPLEQMKLASGSDLLSGVTFSRMLEYDKKLLIKKGQEDATAMYDSGINASSQADYYDQASKAAGAGNLFKTLLGGGMMMAGAATGNPALIFSGASTSYGGIFG